MDEALERRITMEFHAGTLRKPYNVADAAELVRRLLAPEPIPSLDALSLD
jgi:hypothetical protein